MVPSRAARAADIDSARPTNVLKPNVVRRGGSSSLPQALELAANLWVLCRSPVREVNIVGERILKPDSSPPAWNARRTTVGAVVLCACAVCRWGERERAASLPVGRHHCREVAALLPGRRHHCLAALLPGRVCVLLTECACEPASRRR